MAGDTADKTIKLLAMLRTVAGAKELTVPLEAGCTVRDMVAAVGDACPPLGEKLIDEHGQLSGGVQVMLNGRNVNWLAGLDTTIAADDELCILPMVGGG